MDLELKTGSKRCEIVPRKVPKRLSPILTSTIIHEISHSFQLDDEYGGQDSLPDRRIQDLKLDGKCTTSQRTSF